jgi:hypothetical protein
LFNVCLNSSELFSQKIERIIYQTLFSKIFESIDGIFIFLRIIFLIIISFSHTLIISNFTVVQDFHLILETLSVKLKSCNSILFALIIISQTKIQDSLAGDPAIKESITTQKSCFLITAHIHSKSHSKISLNFLASSGLKNSLYLSSNEFINHFIIPYTIVSFDISLKE